jgi:hypothetical protein
MFYVPKPSLKIQCMHGPTKRKKARRSEIPVTRAILSGKADSA